MKIQLLALVAATLLFSTSAYATKGISCKSFDQQSAAQDYYQAKKAGWKTLDRDGDGEACECLPGGSRENESRCEKWRKENGK